MFPLNVCFYRSKQIKLAKKNIKKTTVFLLYIISYSLLGLKFGKVKLMKGRKMFGINNFKFCKTSLIFCRTFKNSKTIMFKQNKWLSITPDKTTTVRFIKLLNRIFMHSWCCNKANSLQVALNPTYQIIWVCLHATRLLCFMLILSRAIFFLFQKVMGLTVGWEFIYKLAEGFGIAREIKIFIFFISIF